MDTPISPQLLPNPKPKSFPSVIIILFLATALGYFGYQNWQLQQQVNRLENIIQVDNTSYNLSSPTPDPTANWKTYTNNQFKFRFSYPPSWNIEEMSKELLRLYSPRQPGVIDKIAPFELRISIFSKVSLQQSDAELTRDIVLPYEKILEQKTINGLPVTISEFTSKEGYNNLVASIVFLEIEIRMATYPSSSSYENIFDQILSTFRFLDQNNEICNIDQEYQNTAVKPTTCQCPDDYEWKILSTSFGPCPAGKARDCPQTTQKCSPKN